MLGTDQNLWLEHGPFGSVPPPRQQVDALGLPSSITWSGGLGLGSGPTNANSNYSLTLSSDGGAHFSGAYNDTGSVPIINSPPQDWVAGVGLPAAGRLFSFSASGQTPHAQTTKWDQTAHNPQIALLWPLIYGATDTFNVSDSSDLGSVLDDILNAIESGGQLVLEAIDVIGIVAS